VAGLNCKARLIVDDGEEASYEYWDDYLSGRESTGTFRISLAPHRQVQNGSVLDHARSIAALRYKILKKREESGVWPEEILFIS
jgi:hypothetical protein